MAATPVVNHLEQLDQELETILTSFDTNYAWNYGSVKQGLRDLYEKAKRDQWNGDDAAGLVDTNVDPESRASCRRSDRPDGRLRPLRASRS